MTHKEEKKLEEEEKIASHLECGGLLFEVTPCHHL